MQQILSIDMGKNKSIFCDFDPLTSNAKYGALPTSPKDFHELFVRFPDHLILIEISPTAGWVVDLCQTLARPVKVVNTTSEIWSWNKVKNKSDRKDAHKLATLEAMNQHRYVHVPNRPVRQWRELIAYRDKLMGQSTACKNQIRAIIDRQGDKWPRGAAGWTDQAMAELSQISKSLLECDPDQLWRGLLHSEVSNLRQTRRLIETVTDKLDAIAQDNQRVARLKTVPGVGNRTAEIVIAMLDNPKRFKNARQAASYTGMTPRRIQSGQMDRQTGISHAGNGLLRKLLVQAAWMGQQVNPWMKEEVVRISAGKKDRKKKAITAVARKLFVRLWAMDRDERPWNGPAAVTPEWREKRREKSGQDGASSMPKRAKRPKPKQLVLEEV